MNRTIKQATVKRCHYDSHAQRTAHLHDFINAKNSGRRLKTLRGLTPYELICNCWTNEPERFSPNPHHQMPGPNTQCSSQRRDQSTSVCTDAPVRPLPRVRRPC